MRRRIAAWEIGGVFWIFVAGSVLHFAYDWLGRAAPFGLVAAVNESVWEHLKLAYWPAVAWAITARDASRPLNLVGLAALLLLGAAFMAFTFAPPHLPIFRDAVTGSYGIG